MNLNLPASIVYPVALLGGLAAILTFCAPEKPTTPPTDGRAVLLAESLATARAEARYNLQRWEAALQDRDTVVRRVVRYIARHDTAWRDHVADSGKMIDTVEVVRWLAVSDSTLRVVRDSLEGELVQCRFDAQTCAEELQKRPTSCNGWSAFSFGFGFGLGAVAGVSGCVVGD